jgi:hypothetical protein
VSAGAFENKEGAPGVVVYGLESNGGALVKTDGSEGTALVVSELSWYGAPTESGGGAPGAADRDSLPDRSGVPGANEMNVGRSIADKRSAPAKLPESIQTKQTTSNKRQQNHQKKLDVIV